MKLKNKQTGEIIEAESLDVDTPTKGIAGFQSFDRKGSYNSLAELNEEWEDVPEEPKEYWYINDCGSIYRFADYYVGTEVEKANREIGNLFDTREKAELAVRKLKAWKRLKDNGMKKYSFCREKGGIDLDFYTLTILAPRDKDSLELLFGGEE